MSIYHNIHIANLLIAPLHTSTKYEMATIFGLTYEVSNHFIKVRGMKTWKELTIGVQQLVRFLLNNSFINPGLVL